MQVSRTALAAALLAVAVPQSVLAITLTSLPEASTSASSCYLGCGNPGYSHTNIIDGLYGYAVGSPYNNSAWNSGGFGGWVQVDFGAVYQLDRIELYGGAYYDGNFNLQVSDNAVSWSQIAAGSFHIEPALSLPASGSYQGVNFGAVYTNLPATAGGRYLRFNSGGAPHWSYLYEMTVEGHSTVSSVPLPGALGLLASGVGLVGWAGRRR